MGQGQADCCNDVITFYKSFKGSKRVAGVSCQQNQYDDGVTFHMTVKKSKARKPYRSRSNDTARKSWNTSSLKPETANVRLKDLRDLNPLIFLPRFKSKL